MARYSHLVPLHDVRPDQAELRKRLDAIRPSLEDRDPVVRALASHALGRGHLALDELETAREYLEAAYELAPENGEIAVDLGRVLSELYREQLTLVERTRDLGSRASLQEQLSSRLESTLRKPKEQQRQSQLTLGDQARELLANQASNDTSDSVELEALRLFHDGNPVGALGLLENAPSVPMWAYERLRLEGDIRRSWAVELALDAETRDQAKQELEAARAAYDQALQVAPSHAALLRDHAQSIVLVVSLGLSETEKLKPLIAEARNVLLQAKTVDPTDFQTLLWAMRIELLEAETLIAQASDPTPPLNRALEASQKTLQIDGQAPEAWLDHAKVQEMLARWRSSRGLDATTHFADATKAFQRIPVSTRDYSYYVSLGTLQMVTAGHLIERGLDAGEVYQAAMVSYRSAADRHSNPFAALTNLALALFETSALDASSTQQMLDQAISTAEQASRLRTDHMAPHYYLGLFRTRLAQDGDPAQWIVHDSQAQQAQVDFEKAIELSPEAFPSWLGLARLLHLRAVSAHRLGNESNHLFEQARQAHAKTLQLAPDQAPVILNLAWTAYFQGKFALRDGLDPTAFLEEAEALCQKSLEIRRRPNALLCLGSVWRMKAEFQTNQRAFEVALEKTSGAEAIFQEILAIDTKHAETHRSLGRLLTLRAQILRESGGNPTGTLQRARDILDQALDLENSLEDFKIADARWYLEQANWLQANGQASVEAIEAGRRCLDGIPRETSNSTELLRLKTLFFTLHKTSRTPPP